MLAASCGGGGSSGNGNTDPGVPPPTNSLAGTVLFNGAPLAGARVVAYSTNNNTVFGTATTDASGNYSFSGLGTTSSYTVNYQFFASKSGYAFNPFMAANPSGSRAMYQWDSPPQSWSARSGAAITREGYNGSFTNPNGGSGILFNVVNFNSAVNGSIAGADFNAYDGTNPLVSLAGTGQTVSYASGDDAAEHQGVAWSASRYVDGQDGTVTDSLTGLVWLKDAGCFAPAVWASALQDVNQLASGACGLTDGSTAGQWRLPNIVELESLVDASASNPAVTAGNPFSNVSSGIYWSSTAYYGGEGGSTNAWAVRLSDGRYINDSSNNLVATSRNGVWAVKGTGGGSIQLQATGFYVYYASGDDGSVQSGAPLPSPRMRDNGNGTVTDTVTGLVWMKQADCINQPWAAAVAAVKSLASGQCGLADGSAAGSWRMPNRKEMQSLADRAQNNLADYFNESFVSGKAGIDSQPPVFANFMTFQYYWTSTTDAADATSAWAVFSCDFGVYDRPKAGTGYTLAVR
jgi:hypothetical protein